MTIAGLEVPRAAHAVGHSFEVLVNGTPDPFWDEVRRHVVSWLIICGVGGIGYLAVQVPIRLDRVLINQESFQGELREFKAELQDLGVRMTRQEMRQRP
jgi:hypothetical protein